MKAEIYAALAQINNSFEQITAGLKTLQANGVIADRYVHKQDVRLSEVSAAINMHVLSRMGAFESEAKDHFGKMRVTIEKQAKNETASTTTD